KVYDISDPYNPVFLETLDVFPEGVVNFFKVGDEALLAQKFYNEFRLIDIRNPSQPQVLPQTIELESGTYQRVVVYEHTVAASLSFSLQTALFDVIVPESASEPLSISQINMLPLNSHTCAYTKQRLYACVDGYAYLGKFDIINPQETYRMETFYPCYLYTQYHMYDPDGSLGPAQPVILLEAGPYGFISYSS
ncbi:MAG: hypothetical protein KKE05_02040, partial [Nanoarchaeota archaeon]|nr:hypothetical protein [Nanoarchaeota archaeon]